MKQFARYIAAFSVALIALFSAATMSGCSLFDKKSGDIKPHLISEDEAEDNPIRPIDVCEAVAFEKSTVQGQLDELLAIVYKPERGQGYRPDMSTALPRVVEIYEAARAVLDRYILNDFSEYERVHVIHDYLAYYIEYDFELASSSSVDSDNPAFGLDGVFVAGKAVCDGFTKAFLLMCGIEQIGCIRITGHYNMEGTDINHAWNKVNLGGVWYNVDATMDSWHVIIGNGDTPENLLNHGYFLLSDEDIQGELTGRHTEDGNLSDNRDCASTYGFHRTTSLGIGSYSMEITDQKSLNDVFSRIKKSKRKIGKVELKLNFPEYAQSNLERADAYVKQISEAYSKVSNADFSLDSSAGIYPYQRYPGGVFVFLIYK